MTTSRSASSSEDSADNPSGRTGSSAGEIEIATPDEVVVEFTRNWRGGFSPVDKNRVGSGLGILLYWVGVQLNLLSLQLSGDPNGTEAEPIRDAGSGDPDPGE